MPPHIYSCLGVWPSLRVKRLSRLQLPTWLRDSADPHFNTEQAKTDWEGFCLVLVKADLDCVGLVRGAVQATGYVCLETS